MFYIEKDNKIVLFDTDKQKLTDTLALMPQYAGLEIQETERPIVNFEFADTEEYLSKALADAKIKKYKEANEGAKAYLESGNALYEFVREFEGSSDVQPAILSESVEPQDFQTLKQVQGDSKIYHIEATDGNIAKLSAYALSFVTGALSAEDTVSWNTKEDETVELNQQELSQVLTGIGQVQAQVWTVKFPDYVAQIEAATTVDDVNAIVVDYYSHSEAEPKNLNNEESEV